MSTDLDELLRETLRARAATVTDAAQLSTSVPNRARRARWLPVAAAAAVIVATGGGLAVRHAAGGSAVQHAGGHRGEACRTTLPKAWAEAFHAAPVRADGFAATPLAFTGRGTVVEWFTPQDGSEQLGTISSSGSTKLLYDVPEQDSETSVDGNSLVVTLSVVHDGRSSQTAHVNHIKLIDLRTGSVRELLDRRLRDRYTPTGRSAVVLAGKVYWQATRHATGRARSDVVLSYDIATRAVRAVARSAQLLTGAGDPRGVFWTGGGVARRGVPSVVPTVAQDPYTPVVGDGTDFAWTDLSGDQQTIGWADQEGRVRRFHVDPTGNRGIRSDPMAVSGPYVFLAPQGYGDPHVYVLDTRTGGFADSGIQAAGIDTATPSRVSIGTRVNDHSEFISVELGTSSLPGLSC